MVKYTCFRCGFTNNIKSRFIKHLNRKFTCQPKLEDICVDEIYNKYFVEKGGKVSPKYTKISPKYTKSSPKYTKFDQNTPKNNAKIGYKFKCNFCDKEFKHKRSLGRHLNDRCKKKKENDSYEDLKKLVNLLNEQLKKKDKELKKELLKKDKQIEELMKKIGVTQNIQTQNNIQNNIKILAYNKTDLSHLNDNHYMSFLNHNNFCVPYMIKKIHFDPKKPENHNIYISNMKNTYIMIWDGKKWNIKDRAEIIDDMIEDNTNILEDKIEDWINKGKKYPLIMKKFNRYIEKKENDIILNKIKLEIKFILFNNRKMIKSDI